MVKLRPYIEVYGKGFFPSALEDEIKDYFSSFHNPGDIGEKGRFKNASYPFGRALIEPPIGVQEDGHVRWLFRYLDSNIGKIKNAGGEDIHLKIAIYHNGQCNGELSPEMLSDLANLGVPVLFSVHELDDLEWDSI